MDPLDIKQGKEDQIQIDTPQVIGKAAVEDQPPSVPFVNGSSGKNKDPRNILTVISLMFLLIAGVLAFNNYFPVLSNLKEVFVPDNLPPKELPTPTPFSTLVSSPTGSPVASDQQQICLANDGKWIEEYRECEGLDQDLCFENKGEYNSCASACRHNPDPDTTCIEICIELCTF